jgi:hypothetical protein
MKLGLSIPINALEDSAVAMTRYLHAAATSGDFLGALTPDEDSVPCVQREWRLLPLEEDIVDLAAKPWLTVGNVMTATVRWMGAEVSDLSLSCRHSSQAVRFKLFARKDLKKELQAIKKERGSDSKRQRGT